MKWGSLLFVLMLCTLLGRSQNSALSFDGQSEFLTVAHDNAYNIGDGFTVEAWIFAEEWKDAIWQGSIVAKDNQGPDRGFSFRCGSNGALSFVMSIDNTWEEAFSGEIMNANQWHHVAAVVDDSSIKLYVDGQQVAEHAISGNNSHSTDLDINIGASPGFGGRNFNGVIDEVRIWTMARSQAQIADNMTVDLTGSEENLVTYLPMNEGSGNVAGDATGNGNAGAFNDMDDSNWVDGYTLPDFDISVQNVYGVDVVNMINRPVKLKVDIQNTGTMPITNINLAVSIDGELYNEEVVTSTIAAGDVLAYEFELPIDLIGLTDPEVTVEASQPEDGNSLNNVGSLDVKTGSLDNVIVMDQAFHNVGQLQNTVSMTLPNDLHRYEQILLNIDLNCPAGGCGIWDVLADLKAITSAGTFELARYITPYGIACGGWVVDITDFKSVLGGEVEFLSSIFVYTTEGWLVNMSIDLIDAEPEDTFSALTTLWTEDYHVYGDPGINDDLAPQQVSVQSNTEQNHVRMTITGHGQGNTNNAAEFFEVDHSFQIGGSEFANHHLWKNDCASNICDDQNGSWLFSRAGWCPGEAVIPFVINTTSAAPASSTLDLDYELQDYTNLLNTGYNNSTHTEPYYKIYSYFVEESTTAYEDYRNLAAQSVVPMVVDGEIETAAVSILNNGLENLDGYTVNLYYDNTLIATESFNESIAVGATADQVITVNTAVNPNVSSAVMAEVVNALDNNPGDNVIKSEVITDANDILASYHFGVFPNPTADGLLSLQFDEFWMGSIMKVYAANGVQVNSQVLASSANTVQLPHRGIYWYVLTHPTEGVSVSGKVIFVD